MNKILDYSNINIKIILILNEQYVTNKLAGHACWFLCLQTRLPLQRHVTFIHTKLFKLLSNIASFL
jgi:hypothetical protein